MRTGMGSRRHLLPLSFFWSYLFCLPASGQNVEALAIEWRKTYGDAGDDQAWSVQETREAGYILAGSTDSFDDGTPQLYLLKLDPSGGREWESHHPSLVRANQVRETPEGYIVAGWRKPVGGGAALLATDQLGQFLMDHVYGGEIQGSLNSVVPMDGGGYMATGYLGSFSDVVKMYVVRADAGLNVVWERTYEDFQAITGNNIIRARDGNYLVVGRTHDYQNSQERMCLLRIDELGNLIWQNTALGNVTSFYNDGRAVFETERGFAVLGVTIPFFDASAGLHIAEVDGQGEAIWEKSFSGASNDESFDAIFQSSSGGYVITEQRGMQLTVSKVLPQGGVCCTFKLAGLAGGHAAIESRDGGVVIAGEATSPGEKKEVLVLKLYPERPFIRGDANHDTMVDIADGVYLLSWIYLGGPAPVCGDAVDANDDLAVDISDVISIFQFLFIGGGPPFEPYPSPGPDPSPDLLGCAAGP